ncbi:MAG: hypothetical protein HY870_07220 [Chloroflexi bacterium]|nr:hypothetical protein [Chloroflexota bacterium]
MGFVKFAVLATMGELLAIRLSAGVWEQPPGLIYKMLVWGVVGMAITFMFAFFSTGVAAMVDKGLLPVGTGLLAVALKAFYTSLIMNVTFGPAFMAAHRVSDTYIDLRVQGESVSAKTVLTTINWPDFMSFVIGRTIPLCWIPAHTATFMLPGEYRVLVAAYLSIVLGIILAYARRRGVETKDYRRAYGKPF